MSRHSVHYVDQVLAVAREAEKENERSALFKARIADEIEHYHRNASYPDATEIETTTAVMRICQVIMALGREFDPVICPACKGERRVNGFLCDRCSGTAQIRINQLKPGEARPFEPSAQTSGECTP